MDVSKTLMQLLQTKPTSSWPCWICKSFSEIIWLGDLNYRINLPYQETREQITKQDRTKLAERDQKGHSHIAVVCKDLNESRARLKELRDVQRGVNRTAASVLDDHKASTKTDESQ